MPEIDHDWDKIQSCKQKYGLYDKIVMGIILISLGFCSAALLLAVINNPRFCM
jgi:hypothetical protein